MPIPLPTAPADPRISDLLASAAAASSLGEPSMSPCPLATPTGTRPPTPKKPARILYWNIFELGGGLFTPAERPQLAIDAYAQLFAALDLHVVVLGGLTRGPRRVPVSRTAGAARFIALEDAPPDTGPAEVARILRKLQALDAGAGWQLVLPQHRTTGATLYHRGGTTAFLYAASKGFALQKTDLIASTVRDNPCVTDTLVAVSFSAPAFSAAPVRVMASLGPTTPERPGERLRVEDPPEEREPTAEMPKSAALFVSMQGDAVERLHELEVALDAEFLPARRQGTVLDDDFWKVTNDRREGLLTSFTAVSPTDLQLQDQRMHWEALPPPEHARDPGSVKGHLADGMLIVHHVVADPPQVQELRVVDLIAAGLASPGGETSEAPSERGVLSSQRRAWARTARHERVKAPTRDAANDLAEGSYFARTLSQHWPLVTQLKLDDP